MKSINDYKDLIKLLPVKSQSSLIRKKVWEERLNNAEALKLFFGDKDIVELSRADVYSEEKIAKKIVMTLMWGYPTGGRGNNIKTILENQNELNEIVTNINGKNLTEEKAIYQIKKLEKLSGIGPSTWSKILYFFDVSVDSLKCQIFDMKIVDSLNKKQFKELGEQKWKQNIDYYFQYLELLDDLAKSMGVLPEQIELFLFYFNIYYKYD